MVLKEEVARRGNEVGLSSLETVIVGTKGHREELCLYLVGRLLVCFETFDTTAAWDGLV